MPQSSALDGKLVVLIGGSGYVGTHIAQDLLNRGARLRVASRNPEKAYTLKPLANLGQLQFARCNVTHEKSLEAAMHGADAVVYLVGAFSGKLDAIQAEGAGKAAQIAKQAGASSFVYVSAIGADANSSSDYARTKALGEQAVLGAFPQATVMRPSVLFGEDDNFLNMFGSVISSFPVVPVFGSDSQLQPLWVDDAAEAIGNALADPATHGGKTYELAGPDVMTMGAINEKIAAAQERKRHFIAVPDSLTGLFAALPGTPMNKDQWTMLKDGSTASGTLPGIKELGVTPKPMSLFLNRWMTRYRRNGRFAMQPANQ
ncbi:NAD(P)H-binding protein [Altererythrobacter indicus]|uniref:NAD(P)H-binding protein n=1 Tax=Altericroceibacterium indicum TaxID=374177 RepID=A0A845A860_9SPHN|nr:complex I NDUFA9 subunit family protein [Altericroceibacterium indicum]MXP26562.1 NAD(P)H-binding protein [Altericroceibacterium indicum]